MPLPYTLKPQIGSQGRLGLIVLQADETIEAEMRHVLPDGDIGLFTSRIPSGAEVSSDSLSAMEAELPRAASLLPHSVDFDVVGYACTSASSVIGTKRVAGLVANGCSTRHVTDPLSALIAACHARDISKLALLTPYTEEVSDSLRATLLANGIDTPVFGSFNEPQESNVARIDPCSIRDGAIALAKDKAAEAVFLSCTNLRTLDILQEVEQSCGKAALSSNQVLFWHMFELAGVNAKRKDGMLWASHIKPER